ncbi:hypothetical protein B0H13DRAFT_2311877 [Mycena leptocephala]|nr:hypothetical protein B0H13DRAFT_2311877 [Mycena leptocephala]
MADSSGPVHFVHNAPPEDHDLKRQYLALLPLQQVIDICLTLDIHVPVALKRNIWPTDFRTVIASMQNVVPKIEETPGVIPPMSSLNGTSNSQRPEDKPPQPSSEPKPPDKQPVAGPSKQLVSPLQPYGFATQPAYPHTPYYQALPPGFAPYSYPAYTNGFPPGAYPSPQSFPPSAYAQQRPLFSTVQETAIPPNSSTDDTELPSYEDMIVEGLNAVDDGQGMAPKDLFNWMAARYPVQSNFRHQPLGGRQFVDATCNSPAPDTKRNTGRTEARMAAASPYTPIPAQCSTPYQCPHPSHPPPLLPLTPPVDVPKPKPAVPPNDAYAAAQNILQTINFGGLFKLEDDERRGLLASPVKSESVSMSLADHARAELQAQLALLAAQLEEIAQEEEKEAASQPAEEEDDDMEEVA